jgi:hypothetical protein
MIDDFAKPAWVDNHEKLAADVAAGLARLARRLRRRASAKDETPAAASRQAPAAAAARADRLTPGEYPPGLPPGM